MQMEKKVALLVLLSAFAACETVNYSSARLEFDRHQRLDCDCERKICQYREPKPYGMGPEVVADWKVKASTIDQKLYCPVEGTKGFAIGGIPFLWVELKTGTFAVNKEFFSDLTVVDAWRLYYTIKDDQRVGKRQSIGKFLKTGVYPLWKVITFLLQSRILNTFAHASARCWTKKITSSSSLYRVELYCVHIFYTMMRNDEEYQFIVEVQKKTGMISAWTSFAPEPWQPRRQ
jgi:hypothetical protein